METECLFRDDSYLKDCEARVVALTDRGGIVLDRTVFYATSGGQPGDTGSLTAGSVRIPIETAGYIDAAKTEIAHVPAAGSPGLNIGDKVTANIDWDQRYARMRMHTALHLLSAVLPYAVTSRWITDAELEANPGLVKTMSVKPPMGTGRVRLIEIAGLDLQPCGGTHVRATGEIGAVRVTQIEKKGKQNRRVRLALA
ncbi:MAG TPA: alanyl-tRNA editing protein [Pseudolabrys sp.]|nr:alanyl-tRNA editing protein [Pseudolabrys sp.]